MSISWRAEALFSFFPAINLVAKRNCRMGDTQIRFKADARWAQATRSRNTMDPTQAKNSQLCDKGYSKIPAC